MSDPLELIFLGTGTSVGVPVIGCGCNVCRSSDPRNQRLRASVLVRYGELQLLVDSGPDLRLQALREKIDRVDAVLYTHGHLDHVAGFDELRAFCWRRSSPLPLHSSPECMQTLRTMFGWAFSAENTYRGYIKPDPHCFSGPFSLGPLRITPLPVEHASVATHGFLWTTPDQRRLAYIPDAKSIPPETLALLEEVDVLIIDALRNEPHPTHLSLAEALEIIRLTRPQAAYLTHLSHDHDHQTLAGSLPSHVQPACDGLCIRLEKSGSEKLDLSCQKL